MKTYAYMRTEDAESREAYRSFGVEDGNIYVSEDDGYAEMMERMEAGDLLVIKTLSDLGRTCESILREWAYITTVKRADIVVLDMPLLDTRTKVGDLTGKLVSDTVMQVLAFAADREHRTSERQAEGIRAAQARGVRFGRPTSAYSDDFIRTAARFRAHEIGIDEALSTTSMKRSNFYYHLRRLTELGIL